MIDSFLRIAGVKSEAEFYKKYPTQESFFEDHPEAIELSKHEIGGQFRIRDTETNPMMLKAAEGFQMPGYTPQEGDNIYTQTSQHTLADLKNSDWNKGLATINSLGNYNNMLGQLPDKGLFGKIKAGAGIAAGASGAILGYEKMFNPNKTTTNTLVNTNTGEFGSAEDVIKQRAKTAKEKEVSTALGVHPPMVAQNNEFSFPNFAPGTPEFNNFATNGFQGLGAKTSPTKPTVASGPTNTAPVQPTTSTAPGSTMKATGSGMQSMYNQNEIDQQLGLTTNQYGGLTKFLPDEAYTDEYPMMAKGGYTVTRSHDRKGKTHKVTGPDGTVKYFGDSKLGQHPNDPARKKAFYARHKHNLEKNPYFRAFARATWEEGGEVNEMKHGGEMIRRADGSYSQRGLWDNIRANAGSGKKPSKEMLEQEAKIKAAYGGLMRFEEGGAGNTNQPVTQTKQISGTTQAIPGQQASYNATITPGNQNTGNTVNALNTSATVGNNNYSVTGNANVANDRLADYGVNANVNKGNFSGGASYNTTTQPGSPDKYTANAAYNSPSGLNINGSLNGTTATGVNDVNLGASYNKNNVQAQAQYTRNLNTPGAYNYTGSVGYGTPKMNITGNVSGNNNAPVSSYGVTAGYSPAPGVTATANYTHNVGSSPEQPANSANVGMRYNVPSSTPRQQPKTFTNAVPAPDPFLSSTQQQKFGGLMKFVNGGEPTFKQWFAENAGRPDVMSNVGNYQALQRMFLDENPMAQTAQGAYGPTNNGMFSNEPAQSALSAPMQSQYTGRNAGTRSGMASVYNTNQQTDWTDPAIAGANTANVAPTANQLKFQQFANKSIKRGDDSGTIAANNALQGLGMASSALGTMDKEAEYNKRLREIGNTNFSTQPSNPTNPFGNYTLNAGPASNFGLVANTPIQDIGTSGIAAKYGGSKMYREGGTYLLSPEEVRNILANGGEVEFI
jgi:hypothetical protein